jgi:hypothetical protein
MNILNKGAANPTRLRKRNYYTNVQGATISRTISTVAIETKQKTLLTTHVLSQVIVLCLAVMHFVLVVFVEDVLIIYVLAKIIRPRWKKMTGFRTNEDKFLAVDREMAAERWPPVTTRLPIKLNASVTELRAPLDTVEIHMRSVGGPKSSLANHEMADQAL